MVRISYVEVVCELEVCSLLNGLSRCMYCMKYGREKGFVINEGEVLGVVFVVYVLVVV